MSSLDYFIFRQNDLISSSFCAFGDMREKGELTDFKFSFGNRSLTGHRLVLAAAIPYFRTVFANPQEEIVFEEIHPGALESVIDFAYCGKIKITPENVRSLLLASKLLKLSQLNEACREFLERDLRIDNVWDFRVLAERNDCKELTNTADHFIRENFEEFSKTESFAHVPLVYLKETISRDDVKVNCEQNVFEAVIRWVHACIEERKGHLPELLDLVRMLHLPPDYLVERVSREELVRTSIPCRDLIDEAKLYYWMPGKRSQISRFITRPRIYKRKSLTITQEGTKKEHWGVYAISKSESGLSAKLLDPENARWINLSVYKSDTMNVNTAVAFRKIIYLFAEEAVITFDVKKLTWDKVDTHHESLVTSGVVLHHKRIYFFGGTGDSSSKVRCFNPGVNEWLKEGKMTRCLKESGVASLEHLIYVTGGEYQGEVYSSVERYDPKTKEWNEVSHMLSKRSGHGCCSLNGKIYVCGGFSSDSYQTLDTTEVYDCVSEEWNFISSMKVPLWRILFVPNNDKIYAREMRQMFLCNRNPTQIYDPDFDQWQMCTFECDPISDGDCETFLVSASIPTRYDKTGTV